MPGGPREPSRAAARYASGGRSERDTRLGVEDVKLLERDDERMRAAEVERLLDGQLRDDFRAAELEVHELLVPEVLDDLDGRVESGIAGADAGVGEVENK